MRNSESPETAASVFALLSVGVRVAVNNSDDNFAFCKPTMRDRVMKNWFKNIIILGMAPYGDFVIICANHFTSATIITYLV